MIQLIFRGDSITAGSYVAPALAFPARVIAALSRPVRAAVLGVPGQCLVEMASSASAEVDPLYDPDLRHNVVVIFGGTNDLATRAAAADVYDSAVAFGQGRRAAGFKVIAVTIPPHGAGAPARFEPERLIFNQTIRQHYRVVADALADVGGDPLLGDPANVGRPDLFVDRVHPAPSGHEIISRYVLAALERALQGER